MNEWGSALLPTLKQRNRKERAFEDLIVEHTRLQTLVRQLTVECKRLRDTVAELTKENELLKEDMAASKSGNKSSAPRVKALEEELRILQSDLNEFRKSQQKVICRYDDDLADTRKQLEASEAKTKKLEREKAELVKILESTNIKLHQTHDELENTEKEKELLLKVQHEKLQGLADVKTKAVLKAVAKLKDHLGIARGAMDSPSQPSTDGVGALDNRSPSARRLTLDGDKTSKLLDYVREVIDDAVENLGDEGPAAIAACLDGEAAAFGEWFERWHERVFEDTAIQKKVLFATEDWVPEAGPAGRPPAHLEKVDIFVAQLREKAQLLMSVPLPCDRAWERYAVAIGEVCMVLAAEISSFGTHSPPPSRNGSISNGTPGDSKRGRGSHSDPAGAPHGYSQPQLGLYRLNTLAQLQTQYMKLLSSLHQAYVARPAFLRGADAGGGGGSTPSPATPPPQRASHTSHNLAHTIATALASSKAQFACLGSELSHRIADAVARHVHPSFNTLYTIDMAYYKKYKGKDSYTKTNQHLKPASTCTMKDVVNMIRTQMSLIPPTAALRASEFGTQLHVSLLQDLSRGLMTMLTDGGDRRWFYAEQHTALEEDIGLLKQYFTGAGVPRDVLLTHFGRLNTIVTTMMSQPTQQLIAGGGVCVPFSDLPLMGERGGIWSKATVLQILAHRKDKQAKAFVKKEEKTLKKLKDKL